MQFLVNFMQCAHTKIRKFLLFGDKYSGNYEKRTTLFSFHFKEDPWICYLYYRYITFVVESRIVDDTAKIIRQLFMIQREMNQLILPWKIEMPVLAYLSGDEKRTGIEKYFFFHYYVKIYSFI